MSTASIGHPVFVAEINAEPLVYENPLPHYPDVDDYMLGKLRKAVFENGKLRYELHPIGKHNSNALFEQLINQLCDNTSAYKEMTLKSIFCILTSLYPVAVANIEPHSYMRSLPISLSNHIAASNQ